MERLKAFIFIHPIEDIHLEKVANGLRVTDEQ